MSLTGGLRFMGKWSRQLASAGLLLACFRFTWISTTQAFQQIAGEFRESAAGGPGNDQLAMNASDSASPGEKKLQEMDAMIEELKKGNETSRKGMQGEEESEAHAELRRLVVDFGPERSDVYLGGRRVGKVPYVGQVHCKLGEFVRVQVLPPHGPPISRDVPCTGAVGPQP